MRVLVVEDDVAEAGVLLAALATRGHDVTHARTVRDGVVCARTAAYDVAIVDLGLPDAAGPEAVTIIRHAARRAAVLVFTGTDDEATELACYEAGAMDVLVKPARLAVIEHALLESNARQTFANHAASHAAVMGARALAVALVSGG